MTSCYRPVSVWSALQRVIHWVMAAAVLILIPLGLILLFDEQLHLPDEGADLVMKVHASAGFVFASALLARIIYLFVGPPESRLGDIVPHTKAQFALVKDTVGYYLKGFKGSVPLYFAHNPFAGLAYAVFFVFAMTQAGSGITMFLLHSAEHSHGGAQEHAAMQAATQAAEQAFPDWVLNLHAAGALIIIFFVLAHLSALAVHDLAERRGLASSMISGKKFFSDEELREIEAKRGRGGKPLQ